MSIPASVRGDPSTEDVINTKYFFDLGHDKHDFKF